MSEAFWKKTVFANVILDPPRHHDVVVASGTTMPILGRFTVEFSIKGSHYKMNVHVIRNLFHSFILGVDFLQAYGACLDFSATNTLTIPDRDNRPQVCLLQTSAGIARLNHQVTIQKQSEVVVQVAISHRRNRQTVLLEPSSELNQFDVLAAKCLVTVNNDKAYFKILNPTDQPVTLRYRQIVASVVDIQPSEVFALDNEQETTCSIASVTPDNQNSSVQDNFKFNLDESVLTEDENAKLLSFLTKHRENFATDLSELGKTSVYKHRIEIKPGSKPVRRQFFRTSRQNDEEIERQIDTMEKHGIIKPSNSEWHSPVVLVRKKNNTFRFACDYRALNKITVPMSFPLPRLESVFDALGEANANYFTSLDLMSGFWQMELDEESREKAAFITQRGVYEWTRMPFGLTNAPISFQTLMSRVLRGLNWKSVLVYVDDVLIFSKSFDEHLQHLEQVFQRLKQANLKLQPEKCHFAVRKLKFLGHVISRDGIEVDPEKTQAVSQVPIPKTQKQIRSFLGMANYYRRFIKDFSTIASPLNSLLQKDKRFQWDEQCQKAFDTIKAKLLTAPVLSYADPTKKFVLTCDASDTAVGYVLGQVDEQKREYVIAYGGKSLTNEQRNYTTTEKECLAVMCGIEAYRPYLVHDKFRIVTDHKALVWLQSTKHTGKLQKWALALQEYNCDIEHRPGKSNNVADALSRQEYTEQVSETDQNFSGTVLSSVSVDDTGAAQKLITEPETEVKQVNQCLQVAEPNRDIEPQPHVTEIEPEPNTNDIEPSSTMIEVAFCYATEPKTGRKVDEPDHRQDLAELQSKCPDFKHIYRYLAEQTLPQDQRLCDITVAESKHYSMHNKVLYHWHQRRCRRVPDDFKFTQQIALPRVLRKDALLSYHDSQAGGAHLGVEKVKGALQDKYHWPGMHSDIVDYIKSCDRCQRAKRDYHPYNPPLVPMPKARRFERWHIDILGPLYKTQEGYEYILLCVDACTRWTEAFPLKTQNAKETAEVLYKEIFTRYGAPRVLFSDRGRNFMSKLVIALCEVFDITQHHTSAYHPNTNGMVERQNSTLAQSLRTYCSKEQGKWPHLLPGIMMAFRKSPAMQSTEFSPYHLVFGEEMRLPFDTALEPVDNLGKDAQCFIKQLMHNLKVAHDIARQNHLEHQQKNKERHDAKVRVPQFKIGDKVLFKVNKVPTGMSSKLHDKSDGPFRIVEIGPNYTYKLVRCDNNKVHPSLLNATNLKLYHDPKVVRQNLDNHAQVDEPTQGNDVIQNGQNEQVNEPEQADREVQDDHPAQDNQPAPEGQGTQNDQPEQVDPNKKWDFKRLVKGRFRNGRREIRVEWNDNSRTWEPDASFDADMLEKIDRIFTKRGSRKKTCFKRRM